MVLDFHDYRTLKAHLKAQGLSDIHLHDACGGQYFTVDHLDDKTQAALVAYFAPMGAKPDFTDDRTSFILLDRKEGTP